MAPNSLMMTGMPVEADQSATCWNRWRTTALSLAVPHVPWARPANGHGSYEWK